MSRTSLKLYLVEGGIRLIFPLFGVALLVAGIFGAISFGVQPLYEAMQTRQWTPVPATLEFVSIEPADLLRNRPLPSLKVRYRYTVDAEGFVGSRYDLHQGVGYHRTLAAVLREMDIGQSVTAWIDPADPGKVVLVRSLNWTLLAMALPFVAIALLGGFLLLGGMVAWNQARPLGSLGGSSAPEAKPRRARSPRT
ncbi:MAG: hypothetical protein C0607_03725 [Azoarcus sp.]|nr:MAG: hypothetical protein C0607_03725 [Azoarcus sp.]